MSAGCIHIIGLGVAAQANLTLDAEKTLGQAEIVIGSRRQLDTCQHYFSKANPAQQTIELPPLSDLANLLAQHQGKHIVILASGDPLYFGIGRWLSARVATDELRFYPAVSSIQAACHSIGLSLQDAKAVSLHGRPLATLRRHLAQQKYLVLLTDQHSTPHAISQLCQEAGFGESSLWVCETLGYPEQQIRQFRASELATDTAVTFDALNVCILKVTGRASFLPSFPGIPDAHFITDAEAGRGLITKREVRLAILSLLQPAPGDIAWDIGAGCGGVAVEWALWNPLGEVHAIEHHEARLSCLAQNRERFGVVNNLHIKAGRAPETLADLPAANKVFIGGSDGELAGLLSSLWASLPANGVIVASAVMENTRATLIEFAQALKNDQNAGVETMQISVSKGGELAGQLIYRPALAVTLFKYSKLS